MKVLIILALLAFCTIIVNLPELIGWVIDEYEDWLYDGSKRGLGRRD